jgi:lipid-A-disaccharide synthase
MSTSEKIFFIACEASADLHTAELIREIKRNNPSLQCRGLGGPKMAEAGLELIEDMTKFSALGFGDVVRQYWTYRRIFYRTLEEVTQWRPDALILVDSPAFNLRFAQKIRSRMRNLDILYYICPQIWAWGRRRIQTVRENISKMFSIFPFEVDFYKSEGVNCEFVGHPLIDQTHISTNLDELKKKWGLSDKAKAVALLPGSRESEVKRIFPVMLESARLLHRDLPDTVFFYAPSPNVETSLYHEMIRNVPFPVSPFEGSFHDNLSCMDFALVTSGTATLQAALAKTPFFLLYKTAWSTYLLGRQLIKVPYLGIVNILANKQVVPEFIQWGANPETIASEAKTFLTHENLYRGMKQELSQIREMLGKTGISQRTAQTMLDFIRRRRPAREIPEPQSAH